METEGSGFIGGRGNNATTVRFAPNHHRLTSKLRVVHLLYGDKEGIKVNVHYPYTIRHYILVYQLA
jgi:hypothetical protein